jgi:hypothetical protein
MARMIVKYPLTAAGAPQSIDMPRRARVLYVCMAEEGPALVAEVLQDADTKAFDVKHLRCFVVLMAGGVIPEGAGYVGSCVTKVGKRVADYHVFEVRGDRASPVGL